MAHPTHRKYFPYFPYTACTASTLATPATAAAGGAVSCLTLDPSSEGVEFGSWHLARSAFAWPFDKMPYPLAQLGWLSAVARVFDFYTFEVS